MKNGRAKNDAETLKNLPPLDQLLQTRTAREILPTAGAKKLTTLTRLAADDVRAALRARISKDENSKFSREDLLGESETRLGELWRAEQTACLRKVINATGVVIHTNLGRAPLSENARRAVAETASGYCTLEYDLKTGQRGRRGARVEQLLAEITGAESALVVNNCAAAAFFVLTALAKGGEIVISRGELVEIGGDFRVPDVMEQSGASLKEVGTTNRTKLADYEKAIGENTRMILRVHPSNYRIVGFTHAPERAELARLAREKNVLFYEDAGSGAIFDLSRYGLTDEPVISDSVKAGADVVTFSGDKLLGGAQAGLIVGKMEAIETLRKHPLYRALRVDKLIYAALEATLLSFQRETAVEEIPVLKMLSLSADELKTRAESFAENLRKSLSGNAELKIETVAGSSVVGGGSAPMVQPATVLLALKHEKFSATRLEEELRRSDPPVIARIFEDKVLIDLRTISEAEETELLKILTMI